MEASTADAFYGTYMQDTTTSFAISCLGIHCSTVLSAKMLLKKQSKELEPWDIMDVWVDAVISSGRFLLSQNDDTQRIALLLISSERYSTERYVLGQWPSTTDRIRKYPGKNDKVAQIR
jgi:hypothetical protein